MRPLFSNPTTLSMPFTAANIPQAHHSVYHQAGVISV
ncbi:hypothetical protein CABS01_00748 [Colletotrichum abscissum]|nr:uncharacterized protein CABS01_00748 [Colletotrichum abscissum]KAK1505280.1 hypothetical protein CABS01_00748 [Colletotrichum abscissum]